MDDRMTPLRVPGTRTCFSYGTMFHLFWDTAALFGRGQEGFSPVIAMLHRSGPCGFSLFFFLEWKKRFAFNLEPSFFWSQSILSEVTGYQVFSYLFLWARWVHQHKNRLLEGLAEAGNFKTSIWYLWSKLTPVYWLEIRIGIKDAEWRHLNEHPGARYKDVARLWGISGCAFCFGIQISNTSEWYRGRFFGWSQMHKSWEHNH